MVSGSTTTWNDYVAVPGAGIVAVRIKSVEAAVFRYVGVDHLGSVSTLTDGSGTVVERDSAACPPARQRRDRGNVWGKRRNANGTDSPTCSMTSQVSPGFTGHEMLDTFCSDIEAVSSGTSPLWSNALCTGRNFGAKFFKFACRTSRFPANFKPPLVTPNLAPTGRKFSLHASRMRLETGKFRALCPPVSNR